MDPIAIGQFIAQRRKSKGMTQRQLAEKLNISDKTISKWECGNGFPEASLIMPLCDNLQITANELLSAKNLSNADYQMKAEENIMKLIKENAENKKRLILSIIVGVICIIAVVALIILAAFLNIPAAARIAIITFSFVVFAVGVGAAIVLDREAGTFECQYCHERFIPNMKSYVNGVHTITKRRLTCPKCGTTGMCPHKITKNK